MEVPRVPSVGIVPNTLELVFRFRALTFSNLEQTGKRMITLPANLQLRRASHGPLARGVRRIVSPARFPLPSRLPHV